MRHLPVVTPLATTALAAALALAAAPGPAAADAPAPRSFDLFTYTPPDGWKVDESGHDHVVVSRVGTKSYCLVGLYGGAPARDSLDASFAAEWQDVIGQNVGPLPVPTTTSGAVGGQPARIGFASGAMGDKPVFVVMSTIDAGARVVSVVVLTPTADDFKVYQPYVQAMMASMQIRRVEPPPPPSAAPPPSAPPAAGDPAAPAAGGAPTMRMPARPLTPADLAGVWKTGGASLTTYVNASTGVYAGFDAIQTDETYTITAKGVVTDDFHGVASGGSLYAVSEKKTGTITISADGRVLMLDWKGKGATAYYVIRGFGDGPQGAALLVNGPYYAPDQFQDALADPHKGWNLDAYWLRKPKAKAP